MKLLVAITHQRDTEEALDSLLAEAFGAVRIDSAGGFLSEENAILSMGVEDDRVAAAFDVLREHCSSHAMAVKLPASLMQAESKVVGGPVQVKVGGASVFILNVDRLEHW